jgi:HEAT repeat protein
VEDPARASVARRLLERCGNDGVEAVVDQYVNATSTGAREALKGVLDELPSTTVALKAMLGDPRPFMVVVAIGLLAERSGDDAASVLGDLRAHADRQVRRALYRALARVEGQAALDLLIKGLGDSDTSVRLEAIASLAQRGGARVVTELSKALQNTENAELLHALLAAVGSIGTPDAVQQLASAASPKGILRQKRVPGLRSAAVAALGEMRLPSAQAALRTLATDRDREVRDAVARALSGGKSAA